LKALAATHAGTGTVIASRAPLSEEAADYLARVVTDGTLKTVFSELSENEPDLAG
jgi:hypothetical protein